MFPQNSKDLLMMNTVDTGEEAPIERSESECYESDLEEDEELPGHQPARDFGRHCNVEVEALRVSAEFGDPLPRLTRSTTEKASLNVKRHLLYTKVIVATIYFVLTGGRKGWMLMSRSKGSQIRVCSIYCQDIERQRTRCCCAIDADDSVIPNPKAITQPSATSLLVP